MRQVILLAALLITLSAPLARAVVYSGAMDNRAGFPFIPGFTAQTRAWVTGGESGGGLRLEWQVDDETTPGSWTYSYRLLRGAERNKGFAFFDIESAADFTAADIRDREVLSANDRFGAPIPAGLASITISDPVRFDAIHDFSNPALTESSAATALNKGELSHYSGDPGRAAPGLPGGPASATPTAGPVPHPFYGMRVTFPDDPAIDLGFMAAEWQFRIVADRVPMWGRFFGWGDRTILSPFWYANFYNDTIDTPGRLALPPADSLTGAGAYRGWVLVPGPLPEVIATVPAAGSGAVPVGGPVSAHFGGIMEESTITPATFTLTGAGGPVSGTVSYHPQNNSASFTPDSPLAANASYTATIAAGVRDLAGNQLGAPRSWSFTTALQDSTAPTVTATLPGDGAANLATTSSFSATFSEAIDPSTLTPASFGVAGVSGSVSYHAATRSATFTPDLPLANNASYTATIGTGVRDLAGNPLAAPVNWSVRTIPGETVLPFVVSTFPGARSVNVVTTTAISATFSEAIAPASITPASFFVSGVSGSTSYDPATLSATFTPAAPLAGNTSYRLTVTTGVRDLAGNGVGLTKDFGFVTLNTLNPNFSASGTVTDPGGAPLPGVALQVDLIGQSGTARQIVTSDAAGRYSAGQLLNSQYLVVPSLAGTLFTPQSRTVAVSGAGVSGLDFSATRLTLTPDLASPRAAGSTITLSAALQGGAVGPFEYRFRLNSGAGFSVVQDYGSSNTLAWRPLTAGAYDIEVDLRNAGATGPPRATSRLAGYQVTPSALPVGSIAINGGAAATNSSRVTLALAAASGAGEVTQMQFSKDGVNFFPFEPFASTRVVTLTPGDGLKTMAVRYKDELGNVSLPVSASITLDTAAPAAGTVTIDAGAPFTNKRPVTLTLSAAADVVQMQFSKDGVSYFPFEPFAASRGATLTAGDGVKSIFVRFRDAAGNISAPASDTITLDSAAPTGTIAFSTPDPTGSSAGILALSASDAGSGVTQMQFAKNGSAFFPWEPFATQRTVKLAPGFNTLTVRFRDAAGNVSAQFTDTITRN